MFDLKCALDKVNSEDRKFSKDTKYNEGDIRMFGESIGIKWDSIDWTPADLYEGMLVELEHGTVDPRTNITNDDMTMTAKIAWAHLNETKLYYKKLKSLEL